MTSCTLIQHSAAKLLAGDYWDLGYLGTTNIVSNVISILYTAGNEFVNV